MTITEREFVLDKASYLEFSHLMAQVLGYAPTVFDQLLPTWHWLFTHGTPLGVKLGTDGHPEARPPGVPKHFVRRLWTDSVIKCGAAEIEFGQVLRLRAEVGQAILKQGRSGELAFVPTKLSLSSGESAVLQETRTGVYRSVPPPTNRSKVADSAKRRVGKAELSVSKAISFNEVDLFRYSALLKVYHRIHYDAAYATVEEGHPGLLVHGPLLGQALIAHALSQHPGFCVSNVAVSVRRPIYVNRVVYLCVHFDAASNFINATALNEQLHLAMTIELDGA